MDFIFKIDVIQRCFREGKVFYTSHARQEMKAEEFGIINEMEVFEAIQSGEIIEEYPDDEPYPSILIYGSTLQGRPIHVVCAYASEDDLGIVITVYEPDPALWIDFRRRRDQ